MCHMHSVQLTVDINHLVLGLLPPCADQGATVLSPTAHTNSCQAGLMTRGSPEQSNLSCSRSSHPPAPDQLQSSTSSGVVGHPTSTVYKVEPLLQEVQLLNAVYLN